MPKLDGKKFYILPVILHLTFVLPFAFLLNIWVDEASTLYTTESGFTQTFRNVFADEKQAPLYFLVLTFWRYINGSVFWARLFSIILSCLAIKYFRDLTRKYFDESASRFATILFALNPFLIWASLEIRVYSSVILLTVLLLNLFTDSYLKPKDFSLRKRNKILFTIFAIIGLYTNYYIGFVLVGLFLALVVLRRFREAGEYLLQMLITAVAFAPLIWVFVQQLSYNSEGFKAETSIIEGLKLVWNYSLTQIFPTEFYTPTEQTLPSFIRLWLARLLILASVVLLVKNKFRALDEKVLVFGTVTAAVVIFFLAAYFKLGVLYAELRHTAILFVPLALVVFAFLLNIFPRKSWIVFAIFSAVFYSYSLYDNYAKIAKRGDWIRVSQYIETNEKPNQPIIVFQTYNALCLPYHYHGTNKILPDEKFFEWHFEDLPGTENTFRKQIEFLISKIPSDAEEVWLATEEICQNSETLKSCQPLEKFIEANYTVESEKDFYLEKVRLLRKRK